MSEEVRPRVLVVDDDQALCGALVEALGRMGYRARGEADPTGGLARIGSWQPDAAVFDLRLPGMDGVELTRRALQLQPDLAVLLLTGFGTIESAVQAVHEGACDYLEKPFDLVKVDLTLRKALEHRRQGRRYRLLAEATGRRGEFEGIVGQSGAIGEVAAAIAAVADTDSVVLISGESGTGKELVARAVHASGARRERPFVTVDCAAIPEALLESELFGHMRGAFTGAHRERAGYFEAASDGTIFLDEVGELPLALQKKLLRILQEKSFSRVGESRYRTSEARVVAATNREMEAEVAAGSFREDLYYRLKVIEIALPPLRERPEDIPLLVHHYLGRLNRKLNRRVQGVSDEAMALLQAYPWPGNIRELIHLLERVMTFHNPEVLQVGHFPSELRPGTQPELPPGSYNDLKEQLIEEAGGTYFEKLLRHYHGNIARVAEHAGLNRRHLYRLLEKLGLDPSVHRQS